MIGLEEANSRCFQSQKGIFSPPNKPMTKVSCTSKVQVSHKANQKRQQGS